MTASRLMVCFICMCAVLSKPGYAANQVSEYLLGEILLSYESRSELGSRIKFFFGAQSYGHVVNNFGEAESRRSINALKQTEKRACRTAFLSTLKTLRDRAIRLGGNAVVNIRSLYRQEELVSEKGFICGNSTLMANVHLVGDIVYIDD